MAHSGFGRPFLDSFRHQLAGVEALPQVSILAVIAGGLTGAVMLAFRGAIEAGAWLIRGQDSEAFEELGPEVHLLAPIAGALVLGIVLNRLPAETRRLGVVHVMERMSRHQGHMPWRGALYQFAGGVVGLTAGLSGGREGPAVHLGAATSSLLGDAFRLPNNSIRTLVACGSAAAIAASFNTPMAGVIFAMEVVMMEYTVASFIPVILAAVTATVVNRWFFGDVIAFSVPDTDLRSLLEVPYIMLAGLAVGTVGGVFTLLVKTFAGFRAWPFWARATAAGAITGGLATIAPAVLGVGYDTVNEALLGNLAWTALLVILVAKIIASAACVGVGLPVGMIGPTLVMGALLGGLIGKVGSVLAPEYASEPALYVMLGMAATMAAVLQAPLAALVAVLELTANPNVILPAMLIIVVATLTVSQVFKQRSIFLATLAALGMRYPLDPVSQHLLRAGVSALMTRGIARLPSRSNAGQLRARLATDPIWIVVENAAGDGGYRVLEPPRLAAHLEAKPDDHAIDLGAIPTVGQAAGVIHNRATLLEALVELDRAGVEALCVTKAEPGSPAPSVTGVLTREAIERYSEGTVTTPSDKTATRGGETEHSQ